MLRLGVRGWVAWALFGLGVIQIVLLFHHGRGGDTPITRPFYLGHSPDILCAWDSGTKQDINKT